MKIYANIYRSLNGAIGSVHRTREQADLQAGRDRLQCIEIEVSGATADALRSDRLDRGKTWRRD
jgi:hypothetical protein